MHPSKLIKECQCRVSVELGGIYDNRLKQQLMEIHPKNIIVSEIVLPIYEIPIEYDTINHHHRLGTRYLIMNTPIDMEGEQTCYADFESDAIIRKMNEENKLTPMQNLIINDSRPICELVLPIG